MLWLYTILLLVIGIKNVHSYPMVALVPDQMERCFKFNIPQDDDAHMILLPFPGPEEITDHTHIAWFQDQLLEMTKRKDDRQIPNKFPDKPPNDVNEMMEQYIKELDNGSNRSEMKIKITREKPTIWVGKYFVPTIINTIKRNVNPYKYSAGRNAATAENKRGQGGDYNDDTADVLAYEVCLDNTKNMEKEMQVLFDIVYVSSDIHKEEKDAEDRSFQVDKHVAPIDEQLNKGIEAINKVIKEMKYQEDREGRMRQTSDSVNNRIQYFSYISVFFLLTVSYTQIIYLKKYFQKIKLI